MASTKTKEIRARNWTLTIHEDDPAKLYIESILARITGNNEPKIAFIKHDKDVDENGEIKTTHYHAVLMYTNARLFSTIKNTYQGAHIEQTANLAASIQYLTHKNNPEKHQYDYKNIQTNDGTELEKLYNATIEKGKNQLEKQLIDDITNGKYEDIFQLIINQEYEMEFISKRRWIIEKLFEYRQNIMKEKKRNELQKQLEEGKNKWHYANI